MEEPDQTQQVSNIAALVSKSQSTPRRRRKIIIAFPIILILLACGTLLILYIDDHSSTNKLPSNIISKISTFHPYYLNPTFSTDFDLQPKSVNYNNDVLEFVMKNPIGKSLIFSEESIPPHFDPSILQTTSNTATEFGQAYITDDTDRTVGTLFTTDNTWIIINAPNPIGASLMQQFLQALQPDSDK